MAVGGREFQAAGAAQLKDRHSFADVGGSGRHIDKENGWGQWREKKNQLAGGQLYLMDVLWL